MLISTGLDSSRAAHWEALGEKLRAGDVAVYAVALGGSLRDFQRQKPAAKKGPPAEGDARRGGLSFAQADRDLEGMAQWSGGRADFPKSEADLPSIYRQLASTLRHQYQLGIAPAGRDGQYHHLSVQLLDERGRVLAPREGKSGHRVSYRQGYVAPEGER